MDIKQTERKDKIITFFSEVNSSSVENAIKEITKINCADQDYTERCLQWARDNHMPETPVKLTPINFILSTYGGSCYDGLALYDAIEASTTPIEITCTGKIMSMGIIVALSAKVRKAHRNTTFMIHQASGQTWGTVKDMEESMEEKRRINDMIFSIIREKTNISEEKLTEVTNYKRDWFITAEDALSLGIITEII